MTAYNLIYFKNSSMLRVSIIIDKFQILIAKNQKLLTALNTREMNNTKPLYNRLQAIQKKKKSQHPPIKD